MAAENAARGATMAMTERVVAEAADALCLAGVDAHARALLV
jgi:hypothetical protein